jgi:lipoprotein-anchoring transpeptidase ErfK/SrfK
MNQEESSFSNAIRNAQQALIQGNTAEVRRWAFESIKIHPDREEPWLLLAAVATPRASIEYLNRALEINPASLRARRGMHWAVKRLRSENIPESVPSKQQPILKYPTSTDDLTRKRSVVFPWLILMVVLLLAAAAWLRRAEVISASAGLAPEIPTQPNQSIPVLPASLAESPTVELPSVIPIQQSFTPAPTETPLPTDTLWPTSTNTALPTETPLPTDTPYPTEPPTPTDYIPPTEEPVQPPVPTEGPDGNFESPNTAAGERWIDVDLSQQRVYAYEGRILVRSFTVSTGKKQTPTVTGKYRIYVKYRSQDMSGPGYYLADVPFVMYFYKGYGLHGTYWHNNFGTPMSHGCVNFRVKEAKWLFEWASVGTIVNVHR